MPFLMLYSHTFKREPNMSQDWAAVAATWRLYTHICCKSALSDPLGTRIGIEIKDVQRRCCLCGCWPLHSFALDSMRWALCQENIHTYIHTCAIQYATHVNNSRPSQLRQSHCMRTSENTEEIIIDPCKWNKQQQASFPTCCAHVCGVSHIFSVQRNIASAVDRYSNASKKVE